MRVYARVAAYVRKILLSFHQEPNHTADGSRTLRWIDELINHHPRRNIFPGYSRTKLGGFLISTGFARCHDVWLQAFVEVGCAHNSIDDGRENEENSDHGKEG